MANEFSRFWNGTTPGDAGPYSFSDMLEVLMKISGYAGNGAVANNNSVILGTGDGNNPPLQVLPASPVAASVRVALGSALIEGAFYVNRTIQTLTIAANSSGNARIDTIVLRVDYVAQTIRLVVKQGTPGASPVRPTLTQSTGVLWEVPLADVAVANGFSTIAAANITNYPQYANMGSVVAHDGILNTTGSGENGTGDVVIWDTATAGAAKKTTTANAAGVAGVWVGLNANNTSGRVIYSGLAWVKVAAATSAGAQLVTSTTAGQARPVGSGEKNVFAIALTSTAGAGLVLAFINPMIIPTNFHSGMSAQKNSGLTLTGSYQDLTWDTELYDTDNYLAPTSANIPVPITGRYLTTMYTQSAASSGGQADVIQLVNGSTVNTWTMVGSNTLMCVAILSLNAGDIIKYRQRNSGSPAGTATGAVQVELLTG